MEYINQDMIKKQRGLLTYMLKKIGSNIFSGRSIMNVSLPIYIFDQRTTLETFAYSCKYIPKFIEKAAMETPLEKLKLSTAYMIATLNLSFADGKPFNPILGETFQCKIGDTIMYYEQTCHHPPIFNYYSKNPHFTSHGYTEMDILSGANSMKAEVKGKMYITFNDGVIHRMSPPKILISGIMIGKRYMNFYEGIVVEDLTNNLISVINVDRPERSYVNKFFSSSKVFPDQIIGFVAKKTDVEWDDAKKVYKYKNASSVLAKYDGEWSNYLNIDRTLVWKQGENVLPEMEKMSFTLPSDSRFRADTILFRNGFEDYAQQAKMNMEEIQRNDRKLRENYLKSNK